MNNLDFKLLSTQLSKANENRKELDNKEKSLDNYIEDAYFHQSHLKGKQDYGH